ncbi:MAG: TIR domain-containing protein [Oscillospiraceae bacterium]|nr:TIR domain-containing protein [Oscillospiraceae bacterium]
METKPYVFISYAHKDNELVYPAIAALQAQGVALWYDNGIEAGSEWPEFVAEKVMNCSKFVLFISESYLQSQNCKRELNFAIARKKDILSIHLHDVELSPGMEMQLGTYQAIFCNRFPSRESFCEALPQEPFFTPCKSQSTTTQNVSFNQSEPANTQEPQKTVFYNQPTSANTATPPSNTQLPKKRKLVAILLAFFLGAFGAHKFYLKQPLWGILYLVFFWTYIPSILSIIDFIIMLCQSDEQFAEKYHCIVE